MSDIRAERKISVGIRSDFNIVHINLRFARNGAEMQEYTHACEVILQTEAALPAELFPVYYRLLYSRQKAFGAERYQYLTVVIPAPEIPFSVQEHVF